MIKNKKNNTVLAAELRGIGRSEKMNIFLDEINVDKRIIPLFRAPIILQKLKNYNEDSNTVTQKKLIFSLKPINEKLVKYVNRLSKYKNKINKIILADLRDRSEKNLSLRPSANKNNVNKYLFLEKDNLTKLKIKLNYLNIKIKEIMETQTLRLPLSPVSSAPFKFRGSATQPGLSNTSFKRGAINNNINNLLTSKRLFKLFGPYKKNNDCNNLEALTNSLAKNLNLHNYEENHLIKTKTTANDVKNKNNNKESYPLVNVNPKGRSEQSAVPTVLANIKNKLNIKSFLTTLNNIQNYIELLIGIKKKLIIKRRISIFKKVLLERAISLKKEELKKKIEIYKYTSGPSGSEQENNYLIFPAKGAFYQKEVLKFKEDIELMLENSFDLLVWLKDKNKGSAELQPLRADLKGFTLTTPKKSSGQLVHPSRQTDGLVAAKVAQPLREKGSAKARKER